MKKISTILLILFLSGLCFFACKSAASGPGTIIGKWKITGRTEYVFSKDGKYTENDTIQKKVYEKGTYTYKNKVLTMINKQGQKRIMKVINLTSDEAKLRPVKDGKVSKSYRLWEKVK